MKEEMDLFSSAAGGEPADSAPARVLFIDTETTGPDPATAEICEIGALLVSYSGFQSGGDPAEEFQTFVKPSEPIPPEASAVHHITNRMVQGAPTASQAQKKLVPLVEKADWICAHNSPFDVTILKRQMPGAFRRFRDQHILDSLRLARHIWPDLPSHSLQALRYRFELGAGSEGDAHRALFDALLVRYLVEFAVSSSNGAFGDWESLVGYAQSPLEVTTFNFGKYRGGLVEDVVARDVEYVRWLLQQKWVPTEYPDLYHTLLRKLGPAEGKGS